MTVYISFSSEIVPKTTESLIAVLGEQANKKVDEVYLMILKGKLQFTLIKHLQMT